MVAQAPLEIKKYFFPLVHVAADPQYNPERHGSEANKVEFDVRTSVIKNEDDLYQVAVEIVAQPVDENHRIPYSVHLIGVGLFTVSKAWKNPEKLLRVNGASMIYSAAREFLITITARGPWNPVILPTVSFLDKEATRDNVRS